MQTIAKLLPDAIVSPTTILLPVADGADTHRPGATHTVHVSACPIGIEPDAFSSLVETPSCQARIAELSELYAGMHVVLGVDRLDPIKGLPHRLLAIEKFFVTFPYWRKRVVFVIIAVPSRLDNEAYKSLTRTVSALVSRVNGAFGDLSWQPVAFINRSISPVELAALYNIAASCLITSLNDGMNLVAEEYIASQCAPCPLRAAPGVLVLSEFAGCAQSLGDGAVICNPWSPAGVAACLNTALSMPDAERRSRWAIAIARVRAFTSTAWAQTLVGDMVAVRDAVSGRSSSTGSGCPAAGEEKRRSLPAAGGGAGGGDSPRAQAAVT